MLLLKRLVATILVLAGLPLIALGGWFAGQLGSAGEASFTVKPLAAGPLVLTPSILNRTDLPVQIEVTPADGKGAIVAIGTPTDATAALGTSGYQVITTLVVKDWVAKTAQRGSGPVPKLADLDVWRSSETLTAPGMTTVRQDSAPETVVIAPDSGTTLKAVTLTWRHDIWFRQALVVIGSGLVLVLVGALMFRPTRAQRQSRHRLRTEAQR